MSHTSLIYGYQPNLAANIVGCVVFGIILCVSFVSGIYARDWWMLTTWCLTATLEVAGYVARTVSHYKPESLQLYEMQLVCLMFAPVFMAAGLYYQLAKQITIYGKKYSNIKPMSYNAIFTVCDVISLFVQGGGGGIASANRSGSGHHVDTGRWIMVAGISFQLLTLIVFTCCFVVVTWRIFHDEESQWNLRFSANRERPLFKYWIPTVSLSLCFLLIRSAYRAAELSTGWEGYLMRTERYFLIFDGLMIAVGMTPLCIIFPGIAYGNVPVEGLNYRESEILEVGSYNESERQAMILFVNTEKLYTSANDAYLYAEKF